MQPSLVVMYGVKTLSNLRNKFMIKNYLLLIFE